MVLVVTTMHVSDDHGGGGDGGLVVSKRRLTWQPAGSVLALCPGRRELSGNGGGRYILSMMFGQIGIVGWMDCPISIGTYAVVVSCPSLPGRPGSGSSTR